VRSARPSDDGFADGYAFGLRGDCFELGDGQAHDEIEVAPEPCEVEIEV